MPRIVRGEDNTSDKINWFTRVAGELADMYQIQFRVLYIEDGLPEDPADAQIFPATPDEWEDITAGGGHFAVGSYFAYDNTRAAGWRPLPEDDVGTHRIQWRWKQFSGSPTFNTGAEDFEVVESEEQVSPEAYITINDVRAEGLTNPPFTDEMIATAILTWQAAIERACRQWFYPRTLTFQFDGDGSNTAHFGVPIISVSELKINECTTALETDKYAIYNRNQFDRLNPHIALKYPYSSGDIYIMGFRQGELKFEVGHLNQAVTGVFGYVESDGSTPLLIKRALLKLVIEKLTRPIYPTGIIAPSPVVIAGVVIEETTDSHSIRYAAPSFSDRRVGLSGITQDPEILDILKLYRAPLGIANTYQRD